MNREFEAPSHPADFARLIRLRDRLADVDSIPEGWPAELPEALEPWLDEEAGSCESPPGEATRRLLLMAEVWECLAADGAEDTGQARFFAEALDREGQLPDWVP